MVEITSILYIISNEKEKLDVVKKLINEAEEYSLKEHLHYRYVEITLLKRTSPSNRI